MPSLLRSLKILEGSLVDRPANPGASIMLFKHAGGAAVEKDALSFEEAKSEQVAAELLTRAMGKLYDNIWALQSSLQSILSEGEGDKATLMRTSIEQFLAAMEQDVPQLVGKHRKPAADVDEIVRATARVLLREHFGSDVGKEDSMPEKTDGDLAAQIADLEAQLGELTKQNGELAKEKTDLTAATEEVVKGLRDKIAGLEADLAKIRKEAAPPPNEAEKDKLFKGLPPLFQQELIELRARESEREERIKKIEQERETERSIRHVEQQFPGLNLKPEVFGPIYRKMVEALETEELRAVDTVLKSYTKLAEIVQSHAGRTGETFAGADAFALIEARAAELRKSQPSLTREQAIDKICQMDPELYKRYREEAH